MTDLVEQRLRREHGIEATVHMDPIVTNDEEINRLRAMVEGEIAAIDSRMRIHDFRFVPGKTHTNLIFDIAVPYESPMTEDEIKRAAAEHISRINPSYFIVVTVDRI